MENHAMMVQSRADVILLMAAIAAIGLPAGLAGQGRVSFEGQGGISMPTGRLADVVDPGPNAGVQLAYRVSPRVALNLDGDVDLFSGVRLDSEIRAPDMRLWRYGGGLSADLLPSSRWSLVTSAGAGVTRFSSDEFTVQGSTEEQRFRHTYFTSNAGLKLGYALGPRVTTYVGARGVWSAVDETDSEALAALDPTRLRPFGSSVTVPVTVGVNVKTGGARKRQVAEAPTPSRTAASDNGDRERRETEARRLCEEAEAALEAGDLERARALYRRAKAEYPGTLCGNAADAQLEKVTAVETIRERIHFEYDRYRITDEAAAVLQRKAETLRKHPQLRLTIEGHCDERGSLEYNQALGKKRAEATVRHLVALGLPESMFRTVSFGKERPMIDQSSEWGWSQNRRSEFVIQNLGAL